MTSRDAPSSSTFTRLMVALDEHLKNPGDPFMVSFLGKDNLRDLRNCVREQQAALEKVMVGGNHLALLIGNHPPAGTDLDTVQAHYLPHHPKMYEAWCCWNTIMEARATLSKWRIE